MTAQESAGNFSRVLDTANTLNTGFIVLEHDNHAQPVNLAIGTTIPLGQSKGFTVGFLFLFAQGLAKLKAFT